jgi:hypothetical protein
MYGTITNVWKKYLKPKHRCAIIYNIAKKKKKYIYFMGR